MSELSKIIGKNISQIRKANGYSQQSLADKVGLKRSTIAKMETGENRPTIEFIISFSQLFQVSSDDVLGIEIKKTQELVIKDSLELLQRKLDDCQNYEELNGQLKTIMGNMSHLLEENHQLKIKNDKLNDELIRALKRLKT